MNPKWSKGGGEGSRENRGNRAKRGDRSGDHGQLKLQNCKKIEISIRVRALFGLIWRRTLDTDFRALVNFATHVIFEPDAIS